MITRISRGFHRIGIVLALPLVLLSAGLAGHEEWLQWSTPDPWAAFPIVSATPTTSKPVPITDPALLKAFETAPNDIPPVRPYTADFTTSLLLLGLAVALYAGARAFGWIVDGFARL